MKNPPEDPFLGMTGAIWRRLDAQEQLKKEKEVTGQDALSQTAKKESRPVTGLKTTREITSHHRLAYLYHMQHKPDDAERLYQEVLVALEQVLGPKHFEVARCLNNLGRLYYEQKRYEEAEPLYQRSLAIVEESFGKEHPKVARRLANLADLYFSSGKKAEADALYQRVLAIEENQLGPQHLTTRKCARAYAAMLREMNQFAKAETIEVHFNVRRVIHERRTGRLRRARARRRLQNRTATERRNRNSRRSTTTRRFSDPFLTTQ